MFFCYVYKRFFISVTFLTFLTFFKFLFERFLRLWPGRHCLGKPQRMPGKDIYVRRQVRLPAEKQPSRRSINVVRRFVVNARQLSRPPAHTQARTSIGQCGDCARRKKTPHREPLCGELDPPYDTSLFVYKNDVRS